MKLIKLSNDIILDNSLMPNEEYAELLADYYHGAVINADISSENAVSTLNERAKELSGGDIPRLLSHAKPSAPLTLLSSISHTENFRGNMLEAKA